MKNGLDLVATTLREPWHGSRLPAAERLFLPESYRGFLGASNDFGIYAAEYIAFHLGQIDKKLDLKGAIS